MSRRLFSRRDFLGLSGRAGAGLALASLPLLDGCTRGNPAGPKPPPPEVPVNLEFKVYNHTQGLQGSFSKSQVMSGTTMTFSISDILAQHGITGVDTQRLALRKENFGELVQYSNQGSVNLTVPRADSKFDIFLFNSGPNDLYQWFDSRPCTGWASLFRWIQIRTYRLDFDGQTGEERVWGGELLPETGSFGVFDQINEVLQPEWAPFRYGYFERSSGGTFSYGFGNGKGSRVGDLYWSSEFNTTINAQRIQTVPEQVGMGLAAIFEKTMGWYDLGLSDCYARIQTNGVIHAAGRDVWAFMYVRGSKAHNILT